MTCQNLLRSCATTLLDLTKAIGLLSSTIQAVEPAKIRLRFLQQQQIKFLRKKRAARKKNKHQVKSRIKLVDKELEVLQWLSLFSVEPRNYYANRCFPDMVGSSLQQGSNMKAMVRGGQSLANKCAGLLARKLVPFFSPRGKKWKPYTLR